jgi:hypothetical protein
MCCVKECAAVKERISSVKEVSPKYSFMGGVIAEEVRRAPPCGEPLAIFLAGSAGARRSQLFRAALKDHFGENRPVVLNEDDLKYEHSLAFPALLSGNMRIEKRINKDAGELGVQILRAALEENKNIAIFSPMSNWTVSVSQIKTIREYPKYRIIVLAAAMQGVLGRVETIESAERALALTGVAWKTTEMAQVESQMFMPYVLNFIEENKLADLIKVYNNRTQGPFYVKGMGPMSEEKRKGALRGEDAKTAILDERRRQISKSELDRYAPIALSAMEKMKNRNAPAEEIADARMMMDLFLSHRRNPALANPDLAGKTDDNGEQAI